MVMSRADRDRVSHPDCAICQLPESHKPSHDGSTRCESGSVASGGRNVHCACDRCF